MTTTVEHRHAVVLDPRDDADRKTIEVLREDGVTVVKDTLETQKRGLARLVPVPGDEVIDEAPAWVYYPWRRTLVAVLGPLGFRRLRLDRNRNKITAEEQNVLADVTVGVVGLSVGHAVAHTLAMEGLCGELRLADFDDLELSNLNRIPSTVLDLGERKTTIMSRRIAELDPYLHVRVEDQGITAENVDDFLDGVDIVVEECDSLDVKVLLREAARRRGIPVVMETSDRGLLDVERFDLDPDRPILHGALGAVDSASLDGLSSRDKVPYVMSILGASEVSPRLAASMVEVDRTISTWPQLGSDVALGGATVASAVRRIALGRPLPSGRVRIDVDSILDELGEFLAVDSPTASAVPHVQEETTASEPMGAIADAALRAPSGGNVQPWTIRTEGHRLVIDLDEKRTSGLDVSFRGSQVALGAALFNARVAAAAVGLPGSTAVTVTPEGSVQVSLTATPGPDSGLAALYEAMLARTTNRHAGEPRQILPEIARSLLDAARDEGASAVVVTDRRALTEIGEVLAESDRIRYLTRELHHEMMSELRWPGDPDPNTGIDVDTLALDATDMVKLDVARRADVMQILSEWNAGSALGDDSRSRMATTSAIVVVMAPGPGPVDHVRAGSAVERVWIDAESHGLAVHPVSPTFIYAREPHEFEALSRQHAESLSSLRRRFIEAAGIGEDGPIALVLRLSHCTIPTIRSRRRPR